MKHFRTALSMVVVLMALASVVAADETKICAPPVNVDLGTFSSADGGYFAWDACISQAKRSLYYEQDMKSDFELWIGKYKLDARGDKAVIRIDAGKVRAGINSPLGAGFTGQVLVGNGPARADIWTPCVNLGTVGQAKFAANGWLRAHENNKPDFWVCPTLNWGNFSATYEWNLRAGGSDFVVTNYRIPF